MVVPVALSVLLFLEQLILLSFAARKLSRSALSEVLLRKSPVEVLGASEKMLHGSTSCDIMI
jgi:hypothetical protein